MSTDFDSAHLRVRELIDRFERYADRYPQSNRRKEGAGGNYFQLIPSVLFSDGESGFAMRMR